MNKFDSLSKHGYALVDYPADLKRQVVAAGAAWEAFCALPVHEKRRYAAANHSAGTGWEQDDEGSTGQDNRENFDITGSYTSTVDSPHPFTVAGRQLADSIHEFITDISIDLEKEYELNQFNCNVAESTVFLRFLHYFGAQDEGEITAEPHTDQSGFTLHLYETESGCERLDPTDREWHVMPVETGKAVLFGAMQMQLISRGEIPALTHRVVATSSTRSAGRYAIVAFIRIQNIPVYDKQANGRLQEYEPGFQYDMPHQEFEKLFSMNL